MTARPSRRDFPGPHAAAYALALVAAIFIVDLNLSLGVASAVPYTFAVLLALKSKRPWVGPAVAALCGTLTVVKVGLVPDRGNTELWKVVANRCLALFAITMTTILGVLRRKAEDERRRAEEKIQEHLADLAHMGRLKTAGQLAAGLAHEINQPLAAIGLQAEIALRSLDPSNEALRPALQEITDQSHRAADIVRGLRRMVRRSDPARDLVNLNDVVESVVKLLAWRTKRAEIEVELNLSDDPPLVLGDLVQLEQVVFNVMENALDAVAAVDGPRAITLRTERTDDVVTVIVRDTGPGLAVPDGEQVFERFYTTKATGMGMGLAISRSIVEAHGGKLWAEPIQDTGAEFRFVVPGVRGESRGE